MYFREKKIELRDICILAVWVLLWLWNWGDIFSYNSNLLSVFIFDIVKLVISITMFVLPGALLYRIIKSDDDQVYDDPLGILPIGFALSVTIVGIIGIIGRVIGLSFETVKTLFMLFGCMVWIIFVHTIKKEKKIAGSHNGFYTDFMGKLILGVALLLSVLMTLNSNLFFIDDFTYLAYLTNWQYSKQLGFNNIIHQADIIEIERFWLALYPMGQAVIADLSGIPGALLFSNYLEPIMLIVSGIASYWFGRALGLSVRTAGISTLIQVSLYTWMTGEQWPVGYWYFFNLAEDKVSAVFILSPVLFFFVLNFIQYPSLKRLTLVAAGVISLVLTHPIILFFSCVISVGMTMFALMVKRTGFKQLVLLVFVLFLGILPYIVIRFYNYSSTAGFSMDANSVKASFESDRYVRVISDKFYGLNPEVLKFFELFPDDGGGILFQLFRTFPFMLALFAGIWSLLSLKNGPIHWYISTCVLLVSLATIPYTGWILGFFSDARLISRASWFSPLGYAGIVVLLPLADLIRMHHVLFNKITKDNLIFAVLIFSLVFTSPVITFAVIPGVSNYFETLSHVKQLSEIGYHIDKNSSGSVTSIAVDYWDTQFLPGVSAKTSIISYREEMLTNGHNFFMSPEEMRYRISSSTRIRSLSPSIKCAERKSLIEEFAVKYIVVRENDKKAFTNILNNCEIPFEELHRTKDLFLLSVLPKN